MNAAPLAVARRIVDCVIDKLPGYILDASGRALYSPITSLTSGSPLYFLGINPGESKTVRDYHDDLTVRRDLERMRDGSESKHGYLDESWDGQVPGSDPVQTRGLYLFRILAGGKPAAGERLLRETPVSNFVLVRSAEEKTLKPQCGRSRRELVRECWSFHEAVIRETKCKIVLTHAIGAAREFAKSRRLGPGAQRPSGWGGTLNALYAWHLPEGVRFLAIPNLSRYDPSGPRHQRLKQFFQEFAPELQLGGAAA